jgi:hypothetical protein
MSNPLSQLATVRLDHLKATRAGTRLKRFSSAGKQRKQGPVVGNTSAARLVCRQFW